MKTSAALAGVVAGLLVAALPTYVALQHNPQDEFADLATGSWTPSLYWLFGIAAILASMTFALLFTLIGFLWRRVD